MSCFLNGPQQYALAAVFALFILIPLLKAFAQRVERRFAAALIFANAPRIHLIRRDRVAWRKPQAAERFIETLRQLGFQDAGSYEVQGQPGLLLQALVKVDESVHGLVCERPRFGTWVELSTRYEDGTRFTYTTKNRGIFLNPLPSHQIVRGNEDNAQALYDRLLRDRPRKFAKPVSAAEFAEFYERAYTEYQDWVSVRGGYSEEEIKAALAASGKRLSAGLVGIAREVLARRAALGLELVLRARYGVLTGLSAEQVESALDRLAFIHDRLTLDDVVETINQWVSPDAQVSAAEPLHAAPRLAFAALNERLVEGRRFRKLCAMCEPVAADVYEAPGIRH